MDGCSAASFPGGWAVLSQFGQRCVTDETKTGQGSMDTELNKLIEPGPSWGVQSNMHVESIQQKQHANLADQNVVSEGNRTQLRHTVTERWARTKKGTNKPVK